MSAPSARLVIHGHGCNLYRVPAAAAAEPGAARVFLGNTISGLPVAITVTSLEWLDELESAIQVARAQFIVQAAKAAS